MASSSNPQFEGRVLALLEAQRVEGVAQQQRTLEVLARVATLEKAARSVDLVLDDPGPGIALTDFGASSVNFAVMAWSNTADYLGMLHAVKVAVYDHLNAAGIEIPFDQLVVHKS